jgi:hypothetical protein
MSERDVVISLRLLFPQKQTSLVAGWRITATPSFYFDDHCFIADP